MSYPDENDLPDAAIKAMWDEGQPVELADRPPRPVVQITMSSWSQPTPNTATQGWVARGVAYLSYFGAATGRYPARLTDAGKVQTASRPA